MRQRGSRFSFPSQRQRQSQLLLLSTLAFLKRYRMDKDAPAPAPGSRILPIPSANTSSALGPDSAPMNTHDVLSFGHFPQ